VEDEKKTEDTQEKPLPEQIGRYKIEKRIATGGMGEIFLAYDTLCHRQVALKRIKEEKQGSKYMKRRFLREALLTCRLSHPAIIPIYTIHQENELLYYTMPFIDGTSLVDRLNEARKEEIAPIKKGLLAEGASIPHLVRIFLSVCHAVEYAHSNWILHRDLKPDNIMVGKHGEVYLLDWGISGYIDEVERQNDPVGPLIANLTLGGVMPGTLPFMAPELANKQECTIQSEIFSLGVILYLILTLQLPFTRSSVEEFQKIYRFERYTAPEDVAPYRDIPRSLTEVIKRCLAFRPIDRYTSVAELIEDLENYIEGKPDWIQASSLDIKNRDDWEFQENVLLAKDMAITRAVEEMEWAFLMISKSPFAGNVQLATNITLNEDTSGIGFLLCVPEPHERKGLEDGYMLWIGSSKSPGLSLFRNNVEVLSVPDFSLKSGEEYEIVVEKMENDLKLYIDARLELSYHSHIPIMGSHVGMLYRDANFSIDSLDVYTGSQNVMVKCLSVPDAFLASKDFVKAYAEYQRIASSFRGRSEEREALFRAGITLLEQAKKKTNQDDKESLCHRAMEEFEKLRKTPGAPMEYLGKALVYQFLGEEEEEIKCLELSVRRYPYHHLLKALNEHIIYRLHETSKSDRVIAYRFALLALRHLPQSFETRESKRLLQNLIKHAEPLPFIESEFERGETNYVHFAIQLAFWLAKPITLIEIAEILPQDTQSYVNHLGNALFCLAELGSFEQLHEKLIEMRQQLHTQGNDKLHKKLDQLQLAFQLSGVSTRRAIDLFNSHDFKESPFEEKRLLSLLCDLHLCPKTASELIPFLESKKENPIALQQLIHAHLLAQQPEKAGPLFDTFPKEALHDPKSHLFTTYGCFLAGTEGEKKALEHLKPHNDNTYPPTTAILGYHLHHKLLHWEEHSFAYERISLQRWIMLYQSALGHKRKAVHAQDAIKKEYQTIQTDNHFA